MKKIIEIKRNLSSLQIEKKGEIIGFGALTKKEQYALLNILSSNFILLSKFQKDK